VKAPLARLLHRGPEWSVSEYVCTSGPHDRPFEEKHADMSIAAVVEGSFNYRGEAGAAVMHPGAFLLGNAQTCYQCGHDHSSGDRCIAFHLAPDFFAEIAASAAGSSRFRFPGAMLPARASLLPWLARIEAGTAFADHLAVAERLSRLVEAVIHAAADTTPQPARPSPREERRIGEVLRHIERHATDALDLDTLAAVAAMSKYHFLRVFRRVVGVTPHQFLLGVRTRRAAVRLATSGAPVSMIAFDEGFSDLSTFNARFRDVFGESPTAYRRRETQHRVTSPGLT